VLVVGMSVSAIREAYKGATKQILYIGEKEDLLVKEEAFFFSGMRRLSSLRNITA